MILSGELDRQIEAEIADDFYHNYSKALDSLFNRYQDYPYLTDEVKASFEYRKKLKAQDKKANMST